MAQALQRIVEEAHVALARQTAEAHSEEKNRHDAEPEVGDRDPADGDHRRGVVDRLAAIDRGGDARGHADQDREDPGRDAELQGHKSPGAELLRHRAHVLGRAAEVALQNTAEPDQVLDDHRLVEVVTLADELQLLFVERLTGADERSRRVAGDREHQREHQKRDQEENGHRLQQAAREVTAQ